MSFFHALLGSGGVVVSAETQAVLDRMSGTIPNNYKSALNTFINTLVASGDYAQIQEIVFYGMNTEANSLIGWKGVRNASKQGSPTWAATTGFTCSNNNAINSNLVLSTDGGSLYTQNSGAFSVHLLRSDQHSVATYIFGGNTTSANQLKFFQQGLLGDKRYAINSGNVNLSDGSDGGYFTDNTIHTVRRTAATGSGSTATLRNGVVGVSLNNTSAGLSTQQVGVAHLNTSGSRSDWFPGQFTMHMIHSPNLNLVTFSTAYQTLLSSLGITLQLQSFPSSSVLDTYSQSSMSDPILIFEAGQSNIKESVAYSNIYDELVESVPNVKVWNDNSAFINRYQFRGQGWGIKDVIPYLVGKFTTNPAYYVNLSANSTQLGRTGSAPYTGTTTGTGTGSLYNISGAVSRFQAAKTAFDALFPAANKKYVLITAIAETDANNSTNSTALENNLQQFWAEIRTALSLPTLKVIFPKLSTGQTGCAFLTNGRTSQVNANAADANSYMINTDSLNLQDNLHFSNTGSVDLGKLIADKISDIRDDLD